MDVVLVCKTYVIDGVCKRVKGMHKRLKKSCIHFICGIQSGPVKKPQSLVMVVCNNSHRNIIIFRAFGVGSEQVGRQIHRSCSLESVRVTSPRDFRGGDDVIDEQVLVPAAMRRTRGFNESFRAAVDRSYTKRQAAIPGERRVHYVLRLITVLERTRPATV